MRNPNGPSIEEKEAMQDQLDDMNAAWLESKLCRGCGRPLARGFHDMEPDVCNACGHRNG